MRFLFGVFALIVVLAWIGYLALSVMAVSEPNVGTGLAWLAVTPVMIGLWIVAVLGLDRWST